jgi:hypothetical protein
MPRAQVRLVVNAIEVDAVAVAAAGWVEGSLQVKAKQTTLLRLDPWRSIRNQFVAQIHNCETARDMRETAVSRWGVSRETARDSARQRETARDSRETAANLT